MRVDARAAWQSVVAAGPWLGVAGLRRLQSAAYAWLYRNDRKWLTDQCKTMVLRRPMGNHAESRIMRSDARYAAALKRAWLSTLDVVSPGELSRESLLLAAPGLKRALKAPHRWPSTLAVLRDWAATRVAKGDGMPGF